MDDVWADSENKFILQKDVFKRQIELAIKVKKPLVFHIRGPYSPTEARTIMRDLNLPKNWPIHMHCFTNSWEDCQEWSQEWSEMKFGLTPDYFVAEVAQNLPLNRILLETDAPYFPPKEVCTMYSIYTTIPDFSITHKLLTKLRFSLYRDFTKSRGKLLHRDCTKNTRLHISIDIFQPISKLFEN